MSANLQAIAASLQKCRIKDVKAAVEAAVAAGEEPKAILNEGLLAGMNVVGKLFKDGEMYVPEVLMAAKAMQAGIDVIAPMLGEGDVQKKGKVLIATVKGDLHDIGTKLVAMMMSGAGYEIINMGVDVSAEQIVAAVAEHQPDIVGMASMLTTTMGSIKDVLEALEEAKKLDKVSIIVGGAPITDDFAKELGAYYAPDATTAVELADKLVAVDKMPA